MDCIKNEHFHIQGPVMGDNCGSIITFCNRMKDYFVKDEIITIVYGLEKNKRISMAFGRRTAETPKIGFQEKVD